MSVGPGEHDPVIECVEVNRTFGSGATAVDAVRGVTCQIWASDQIAVTGKSGSGKTTLLHLLAGLDAPTAGSVRWPGLGGSLRGRAIAMVFQAPSLLPSLDVTENVALPLIFAGRSHSIALHEALAALRLLGLEELATKLPGELSGGQSQRVAVARALAIRPAVILADEPTGQVDHHTAEQVATSLLDTAISIGAAVVISTHDPAIAARMPDQWVMRDGRLDTHSYPAHNSP